MRAPSLSLATLLALAGCDSGAGETSAPAETAAETPAPAPATPAAASPDITEIPVAIRGRWGLVPADCEPGRDDAKGLLMITSDKLEFYESVGTLDDIEEAGPGRIRASFDFTGEGMTWERDILLELQDGGGALVRREFGTDAAPDPFRYTKCLQGRTT